MKKYVLLFSALFVLSACQLGNNDSKDSTTKETASATLKTSSSQVSSEKNTSSSSSSTNSSTTSSSKTANSSSATDSTHSDHSLSANEELKANYPNDQFPDPTTISSGKQIGITASEEQGILKVNYYIVDKETPFNDASLNNQTPIAQYQRQTYASNAEAQSAVGQNYDPNGQQVDLGHNITGYQNSGAGSTYLTWKEGNWSIGVQANNLEQENPVPFAKQVVEYLEGAFLPVPQTVGQISLRVSSSDYQSNRIAWQNNQAVYTIMNSDGMNGLKMAVSMAQ